MTKKGAREKSATTSAQQEALAGWLKRFNEGKEDRIQEEKPALSEGLGSSSTMLQVHSWRGVQELLLLKENPSH